MSDPGARGPRRGPGAEWAALLALAVACGVAAYAVTRFALEIAFGLLLIFAASCAA